MTAHKQPAAPLATFFRATRFMEDRPGWSIEAYKREDRFYVTIHADLKWVCTTVGDSYTEALAAALDEAEERV